jgi:hypothetical protein
MNLVYAVWGQRHRCEQKNPVRSLGGVQNMGRASPKRPICDHRISQRLHRLVFVCAQASSLWGISDAHTDGQVRPILKMGWGSPRASKFTHWQCAICRGRSTVACHARGGRGRGVVARWQHVADQGRGDVALRYQPTAAGRSAFQEGRAAAGRSAAGERRATVGRSVAGERRAATVRGEVKAC